MVVLGGRRCRGEEEKREIFLVSLVRKKMKWNEMKKNEKVEEYVLDHVINKILITPLSLANPHA